MTSVEIKLFVFWIIFFGQITRDELTGPKAVTHLKNFYLFIFWPHLAACGILVSPGIEPVPPAVKAQSPNHWTAREFPIMHFKDLKNFWYILPKLLMKKSLSVYVNNVVLWEDIYEFYFSPFFDYLLICLLIQSQVYWKVASTVQRIFFP